MSSTAAWHPLCVVCVLCGITCIPAVTLVYGDPVCSDHASLRMNCDNLVIAVREARLDLGRRP
jgi:hypothetical protein